MCFRSPTKPHTTAHMCGRTMQKVWALSSGWRLPRTGRAPGAWEPHPGPCFTSESLAFPHQQDTLNVLITEHLSSKAAPQASSDHCQP